MVNNAYLAGLLWSFHEVTYVNNLKMCLTVSSTSEVTAVISQCKCPVLLFLGAFNEEASWKELLSVDEGGRNPCSLVSSSGIPLGVLVLLRDCAAGACLTAESRVSKSTKRMVLMMMIMTTMALNFYQTTHL